MTAAAKTPNPQRRATAADLGHPVRYPVFVDDAWHAACACHWWQIVVPPQDVK